MRGKKENAGWDLKGQSLLAPPVGEGNEGEKQYAKAQITELF